MLSGAHNMCKPGLDPIDCKSSFTLKLVYLEFFLLADNLPASFFNIFMRVSYLKVIHAQPGGHIEAFGDLRSPKISSQQPSESNFFKRMTLYYLDY